MSASPDPSVHGYRRLTALLAGVMALCISGSVLAQASWPSGSFALRAVRLFDGERVTEQATVIVRDGRIAAVGGRGLRVPAGMPVLDGAGQTLLPGLIDAHVHLVDSYKGSGALAFQQAAAYGITTVLDLATGNPDDYKVARSELKSGRATDTADVFTAGPGATPQVLKGPDDALAWVQAHRNGGADFIKIFGWAAEERGGREDAVLSLETMDALIDAAHRAGYLSISHALTERVARHLVEHGLNGLVHLSPLAQFGSDYGAVLAKHHTFQSTNLIGVAPAAIRQRLGSDASLAPFLPSWMADDLKSATDGPRLRYDNELFNLGLVRKAGVLVLAGTDAFFPYPPVLHAELEILAGDGGLGPVAALQAATANAARAYRLADRGRVARGLRADLLLVDGDPTRDILATRHIRAVWIAGRVVDRDALQPQLSAIARPAKR